MSASKLSVVTLETMSPRERLAMLEAFDPQRGPPYTLVPGHIGPVYSLSREDETATWLAPADPRVRVVSDPTKAMAESTKPRAQREWMVIERHRAPDGQKVSAIRLTSEGVRHLFHLQDIRASAYRAPP